MPVESRWEQLLAAASQADIGERVDRALDAIERDNPEQLRGVLPKIHARAPIQPAKLGSLVETIARIGFGDDPSERATSSAVPTSTSSASSLGGRDTGAASTTPPPPSPACWSKCWSRSKAACSTRPAAPAALFVQSAEFVKAHGGRTRQIAILGQENNQATWRICRMNLAIHELSGDVKLGDSLLDDHFSGARADYVLANPPFNMKRWGAAAVAQDARWSYGEPPDRNANYAWIQHFIHHLAPDGRAGFVMANGSLTSSTSGEGEIRKEIVEADLVDCIVALPGQLFFTTGIPVSLWFVDRNKASARERDRPGETLFIDARGMGRKISRTQMSSRTRSSRASSTATTPGAAGPRPASTPTSRASARRRRRKRSRRLAMRSRRVATSARRPSRRTKARSSSG